MNTSGFGGWSWLLVALLEGSAQELIIHGVQDRTVYADQVSLRVPALDGFQYTVRLDAVAVPTDTDIAITDVDYHELWVERTSLIDSSTTNRLVQFIVRASERANTEWGLPPWTPYPIVPSSPAEFAGAALRLLMPAVYVSDLPLPMAVFVEDSAGYPVRVNGVLRSPSAPPIVIRRGIGSGLLPALAGSEPGPFEFVFAAGGLEVAHEVELRANAGDPGGRLEVSGAVAAPDTRWAANRLIDVVGDVMVPEGVTLTIDPDATVRLQPGVDLYVRGVLRIEGAVAHPVVFVPADWSQTWGGIITTSSAPAVIEATGAIFVGSGADANWFDDAEGYATHRDEQALVLLDNARATFTDCAFLDGLGQFGHGRRAQLEMTRCVVQRFITGGEFVGGGVTLDQCAFLEFPVDSPEYQDEDNDGMYFTEGTHVLRKTLVGWAKDDAVDAGSGGAGSVLVTNCWIEAAYHEGLAWSGGGRVTKTIDTVILNCGQGLEAGFSNTDGSPDVFAERLLSIGNLSGARFGDNYDWTYNGFLRITNSFLLCNYRDFFGLNWDDWTYRQNQIDLQGNYLTAPDPRQPDNALWDADADGWRLAPFLATPPEAPVGLALLEASRQLPMDRMEQGVPVGLSSFRTNPVIAQFVVAGAKGWLADRTLLFHPGETVKPLMPHPLDLGEETLIRVRLSDLTGAEPTGSTEVYYYRSATPTTNLTLVSLGALWRYLDTGVEPDPDWTDPTYADDDWLSGRAELGYGEGDETTPVRSNRVDGTRIVTTYFRHRFTAPDLGQVGLLWMRLKRDDGGIVYLNGTEVFRSNLTTGYVDSLTFATNAADDGKAFFGAELAASLLRLGDNVVAVEIHQDSLTSSDISFDLELVAQPPPVSTRLEVLEVGTDLVLFWSEPTYRLQSAPAVTGPWDPPDEQPSPVVLSPTHAARFYRLSK